LLADRIKSLNCKKALIYHNITPEDFFDEYNEYEYRHYQKGREQLRSLVGYFDFVIGDSDFNASELDDCGFENVFTLPIFVDFDLAAFRSLKCEHDDDEEEVTFLFPARFAPNKKHEDLIKSFYIYNKYKNSYSRLILPGNVNHTPLYTEHIGKFIAVLDIEDKVDTLGFISDKELDALFVNSDVLLCLSEHEGFCVPLVEAMAVDLPIVACESSAASETMGRGHPGLLKVMSCRLVAEALDKTVCNEGYREKILAHQRKQYKCFELAEVEDRLFSILDHIDSSEKEAKIERPTISVIVNTYNRWDHLQNLMKELQKQDYPFFEVVIVNGPSTDETYKVKELYPGVKYVEIDVCNICVSRNVGIREAAGQYLVYIDDDALPGRRDWLSKIVKTFETDKDVVCVAGPVKHNWTDDYEFYRGFSNHYARQGYFSKGMSKRSLKSLKKKLGYSFERCSGGNAAFRKDVLVEIGGFDEYYIYYLDETDVCDRFVSAGYKVQNIESNFVRHFKGTSAVRGDGYNLKWSIIGRSIAYYGMKNGKDWYLKRVCRTAKTLYNEKFLEIFSCWRKKEIRFLSMVKYLVKYLHGGVVGIFAGTFRSRKFLKMENACHEEYRNYNFLGYENSSA
jgi:GT2 family glycosyltransferase